MSNCNATVTPLEIEAKLRKETNDEFVSATMYKQIIGSLRYLCNTRLDICQRMSSNISQESDEIHQMYA